MTVYRRFGGAVCALSALLLTSTGCGGSVTPDRNGEMPSDVFAKFMADAKAKNYAAAKQHWRLGPATSVGHRPVKAVCDEWARIDRYELKYMSKGKGPFYAFWIDGYRRNKKIASHWIHFFKVNNKWYIARDGGSW